MSTTSLFRYSSNRGSSTGGVFAEDTNDSDSSSNNSSLFYESEPEPDRSNNNRSPAGPAKLLAKPKRRGFRPVFLPYFSKRRSKAGGVFAAGKNPRYNDSSRIELSSPAPLNTTSTDIESLVQPNRRLSSSDIAEELEGTLEVPRRPVISAGYADIYHGVWTTTRGERVQVAIKEFKALVPRTRKSNPEALKKRIDTRIKREVFVWSKTEHPNIHPLLGHYLKPKPRLISPWCLHGNLMDYLQETPYLTRLDKLRLIYQAACGLNYLHSQKPPICHADIKPENVLVNDQLKAVLSDFGLSLVLEGLGVASGLTTSNGAKGTIRYMASELFEDQKPNRESDIYSFGGLILAVMSGKPPFPGRSEATIISRVVLEQFPKPEEHPDLPPSDSMWSLMRRCWCKDPGARPAMREVVSELAQELGVVPDLEPQPSTPLAPAPEAEQPRQPEPESEQKQEPELAQAR